MGDRVDRDDVSVVGQVSGPDGGQVPALSVEHADGAALGGDVKTLRSLVVGQDVGSAHPCRSRKLTRVSAAASGSPRADIENPTDLRTVKSPEYSNGNRFRYCSGVNHLVAHRPIPRRI